MGNKYLLIVEGAKTEQKIFSSVLKNMDLMLQLKARN